MIALGAGYTPLVLLVIMVLLPMKVCTPTGLHTWPPGKPGVLKPGRSHGCTARLSIGFAPLPAYAGTTVSLFSAISHALARGSSSFAGTTSWIRPRPLA